MPLGDKSVLLDSLIMISDILAYIEEEAITFMIAGIAYFFSLDNLT